MLHDISFAPAAERVTRLNVRHADSSAISVLEYALSDSFPGKTALVSSFGAESVVLLHLVSVIDRSLPVLFLDTQMLFPETLDYQAEVAAKLGLSDVRIIRPDQEGINQIDPDDTLHQRDHDACCALRKTEPLERALEPFDAWISGRKRFQGGTRMALEFFEVDSGARIKVNPLAHWTQENIREYMEDHQLPRHPLVARGYPSIGCATCTSRVASGEDPRSGRWRGADKDECGIHFVDGQLVRGRQAVGGQR